MKHYRIYVIDSLGSLRPAHAEFHGLSSYYIRREEAIEDMEELHTSMKVTFTILEVWTN